MDKDKAQLAQEPMPNRLERLLWEYIDLQAAHPEHKPNHKTWSHLKVYAPLPEQKPVAWLEPEWGEMICPEIGFEATTTSDHPRDLCWIPLYPHQPQRTWVGLTEQDIDIAFDDTQEGGGFDDFARAIEAKLKDKNT